MHIRSSAKPLMLSLAVATLTACGAGSGDGTTDPSGQYLTDGANAPTVLQGQFLDSAVEGLRYETATQSGFTNEFGSFNYVPGESITFYLGSTWLGEVIAKAELTPLDLINAADDPDKLQNLLRILQTLDADSDPSNGITINPTAQAYLDQFVLPLNQPAFLFEASEVVNDLVRAATNGTGLKDALDSFVHFRETMLGMRRTTDQTPVLNLIDTKWDVTLTSSLCEGTTAHMIYRFNVLGITSEGNHRINEDTCKSAGWAFLFNTYETDPLFTCANQCLDADLNRVIIEQDENGEVVTTLRYDEENQQITINTTRFSDAGETVTTSRVMTRRS